MVVGSAPRGGADIGEGSGKIWKTQPAIGFGRNRRKNAVFVIVGCVWWKVNIPTTGNADAMGWANSREAVPEMVDGSGTAPTAVNMRENRLAAVAE